MKNILLGNCSKQKDQRNVTPYLRVALRGTTMCLMYRYVHITPHCKEDRHINNGSTTLHKLSRSLFLETNKNLTKLIVINVNLLVSSQHLKMMYAIFD